MVGGKPPIFNYRRANMFEQLVQDILIILDAPIEDTHLKLGLIREMSERTFERKIVEESRKHTYKED